MEDTGGVILKTSTRALGGGNANPANLGNPRESTTAREHHTVEACLRSKMQEQTNALVGCPQIVQELSPIRLAQLPMRLHFNHHLPSDEEVCSIHAHNTVLVSNFERVLSNVRNASLPELHLERTGVHALEETVSHFVVDGIERTDDFGGAVTKGALGTLR